ncbi:transposase [Streptomyces violascens]|uniref:transposase n=1 Tax=Streptomyces violascens TaxID=67381 RepID=UPI00368E9318
MHPCQDRRPYCHPAPAQTARTPLHQLHKEQATDAWHDRYATRAGVEGTISQAVRAFGLRRCRYRGLAKTQCGSVPSMVDLRTGSDT